MGIISGQTISDCKCIHINPLPLRYEIFGGTRQAGEGGGRLGTGGGAASTLLTHEPLLAAGGTGRQ